MTAVRVKPNNSYLYSKEDRRILHPAVEPSAQERYGPAGAGPEEAIKMI